MPKNVYFWGTKERAQHNTERHQVFVKELYSIANLSPKEFNIELSKFKEKNFDLLDSEKHMGGGGFLGVLTPSTRGDTGSKLNNKLEG